MADLSIHGISQAPVSSPSAGLNLSASRVSAADPAAGIGECETCRNRTYQDQSDDPTVSFQMPTRLSPGEALDAVLSHEGEHVRHDRTRAAAEGRRVVSQSVVVHRGVCPE